MPVYVASDSTLFFRRGGARSKNETILTEVATFLGNTTKGLMLMDIICSNGAKGKELADEVERLLGFSELAPPGGIGLFRGAVFIVFSNCNDVASQTMNTKSRWREALQSDAGRLAVQSSQSPVFWAMPREDVGAQHQLRQGRGETLHVIRALGGAARQRRLDVRESGSIRPLACRQHQKQQDCVCRLRFVARSASGICAASKKT